MFLIDLSSDKRPPHTVGCGKVCSRLLTAEIWLSMGAYTRLHRSPVPAACDRTCICRMWVSRHRMEA